MRRLFQCAILVALAVTVYFSSLHNSWHFDDHHSILRNPAIRKITNTPSFFTDTKCFTGNKNHTGSMYRPVLLMSYALTYFIGGYSLPLWHAFQITLHALCILAIFLLLKVLEVKDEVALLASAFFAIHPINSHAVNYLCSRSEIQASLFYAFALALYFKSVRAMGRAMWLMQTGAILSFAAALFTKTIAITLPAVVILWELWLGPKANETPSLNSIKPIFKRVFPFILVSCGYLVLRRFVTGGMVLGTEGIAQTGGVGLRLFKDGVGAFAGQTMGSRSIVTNFLVQVTAFWKYLWLLFWPPALSIVHDLNLTPSLLSWPTLPALFAFIGLICGLLALRKLAPLLSFCGLFTLLVMAPTSLIPLNLPMNEHRVYLAFVGLFVIFSTALLRAFDTPRSRKALPLTIGVLIALFSTATLERNRQWTTPLSLWSDAVIKAPQSRYAHLNYANALYEAGKNEAALWHGERTLAIFPAENPVLWARHARLHLTQGNLLLAQQYLKAALEYDGNNLDLLTLRADLLVKIRKPQEAVKLLAKLERKGPKEFRSSIRQAKIHLLRRLREMNSKIKTLPPGEKRARLLLLAGYPQKALEDLGPVGAWSLRGEILLLIGEYKKAAHALSKASFPQAAEMLVIATVVSGKEAEGRRLAEKALRKGVPLGLEARFYAGLAPYGNKS